MSTVRERKMLRPMGRHKRNEHMEMILQHQNFMLAVRQQMGWPSFKPANDCIGFTSGREMDFEVGTEIARIAQMIGKDLIYTGWPSIRAKDPTSLTVVFREMLTVDVIDGVVPWAANDESPIVLLSTRSDEFFAIDRRGSLVRVAGKPKGIGKGRKLAMKRIKSAASGMGDTLLENNRFVPTGADRIERDAPSETMVRFG